MLLACDGSIEIDLMTFAFTNVSGFWEDRGEHGTSDVRSSQPSNKCRVAKAMTASGELVHYNTVRMQILNR